MYNYFHSMHNHLTFVKPKPRAMLHYEIFAEQTLTKEQKVFWKPCWKHIRPSTLDCSNTIYLLCPTLSFSTAVPYTWYNTNIAQTTALGHYHQDFEINYSVKKRQHPLYSSYYFSQPYFGEKQINISPPQNWFD